MSLDPYTLVIVGFLAVFRWKVLPIASSTSGPLSISEKRSLAPDGSALSATIP